MTHNLLILFFSLVFTNMACAKDFLRPTDIEAIDLTIKSFSSSKSKILAIPESMVKGIGSFRSFVVFEGSTLTQVDKMMYIAPIFLATSPSKTTQLEIKQASKSVFYLRDNPCNVNEPQYVIQIPDTDFQKWPGNSFIINSPSITASGIYFEVIGANGFKWTCLRH